jgi:hypothetical protein
VSHDSPEGFLRLFIVHCGYYDPALSAGAYESHTNFLVAAEEAGEAKAKAKGLAEYRRFHMHVDSVQEVVAVQGHEVALRRKASLGGKTLIRKQKYGSRKVDTFELE